MKKDKNELAKKQHIIQQFMKERDLPDWFRGLSTFQREAADSLLNCIRDDSEQATSHRVRDALRRIGIEPPVGPAKIKLVMRLSRGNDIAFLWFLMELYYRSSEIPPQKYSVNEQIFLTVIAYLDTIPTLRELDKMLPKRVPGSKERRKKSAGRKKLQSTVLICPYFEKQRRPKLYGKSLILHEIDNNANFSEYEKYRYPNYVVMNENSRWFANYKLNKVQRIAKGIIDDQIDRVFQELCGNEEKSIVCAHHQNLQALKESMENAFKVAKMRECEKYFDVEGYFRNQSYKRVMCQLNKEIAKINKAKAGTTCKRQVKTVDVEDVSEVPAKVEKNLFDYGHDAVLNAKCNLFKAATPNKPYQFNYNKIFDLGAKDPVRDAITAVLNAGRSCSELDQSAAVKNICKKIWTNEVRKHNLNCKNERQTVKQKTFEQNQLEFEKIDFDPRNSKLMESMLYRGLQELKKNKKFVLASLPDAHKCPILKEWIRNRYGMVYTRQEKRRTFKRTKKVFQVLRNNALRVRIPRLDDLSRKRMVSYGCREYLLRKTKYLKEIYEDNFKESLLDDSRIYWAAVRPYQCSKGPPRNVFFAYLPARKNDVHMFRPWKVREYIHAKEEWDRRQRNKEAEISY